MAHFSHPLVYPFQGGGLPRDGLEGPIGTEAGDGCQDIMEGNLNLGI